MIMQAYKCVWCWQATLPVLHTNKGAKDGPSRWYLKDVHFTSLGFSS